MYYLKNRWDWELMRQVGVRTDSRSFSLFKDSLSIIYSHSSSLFQDFLSIIYFLFIDRERKGKLGKLWKIHLMWGEELGIL